MNWRNKGTSQPPETEFHVSGRVSQRLLVHEEAGNCPRVRFPQSQPPFFSSFFFLSWHSEAAMS